MLCLIANSRQVYVDSLTWSFGNLFQSFTSCVFVMIEELSFTEARLCPLVLLSVFKDIFVKALAHPCFLLKSCTWSPPNIIFATIC